jgi:hypothetical protein
MASKINVEIEKLLNGYILTLVSGNKVFCGDIENLVIRIRDEIELEVI